MLGMSLSICSMVIVLLFVKRKLLVFCFWILFCFIPFSCFVYDGESSNLYYAYRMGTQEVIEVWFGIIFMSFVWALVFFIVALVIYFILKILLFTLKSVL
ncbi:hypothetical protein CQA53_10285 [Helicobacter didelphidarum]|uniref:Uncharacterized protein n=1 Tax=Helicobacter didelphidarum TaxID=2040648 RepID=A0A3D8I860_9HELI|nr:hypothetical protein [Helicobacter didelphidarum]RDU61339.1 hypothetical protein CQA53_10285 [Helicobacter didelphidarum]